MSVNTGLTGVWIDTVIAWQLFSRLLKTQRYAHIHYEREQREIISSLNPPAIRAWQLQNSFGVAWQKSRRAFWTAARGVVPAISNADLYPPQRPGLRAEAVPKQPFIRIEVTMWMMPWWTQYFNCPSYPLPFYCDRKSCSVLRGK
jgi:hypothetical protein